jgi:hypothetical protein
MKSGSSPLTNGTLSWHYGWRQWRSFPHSLLQNHKPGLISGVIPQANTATWRNYLIGNHQQLMHPARQQQRNQA